MAPVTIIAFILIAGSSFLDLVCSGRPILRPFIHDTMALANVVHMVSSLFEAGSVEMGSLLDFALSLAFHSVLYG